MPPVPVSVQGALHLSQLFFGHGAEFQPETGHDRVGQAITNMHTLPFGQDQASLLEPLQVMRGISHAHMCLGCQLLDGTRSLHQQIQKL